MLNGIVEKGRGSTACREHAVANGAHRAAGPDVRRQRPAGADAAHAAAAKLIAVAEDVAYVGDEDPPARAQDAGDLAHGERPPGRVGNVVQGDAGEDDVER